MQNLHLQWPKLIFNCRVWGERSAQGNYFEQVRNSSSAPRSLKYIGEFLGELARTTLPLNLKANLCRAPARSLAHKHIRIITRWGRMKQVYKSSIKTQQRWTQTCVPASHPAREGLPKRKSSRWGTWRWLWWCAAKLAPHSALLMALCSAHLRRPLPNHCKILFSFAFCNELCLLPSSQKYLGAYETHTGRIKNEAKCSKGPKISNDEVNGTQIFIKEKRETLTNKKLVVNSSNP